MPRILISYRRADSQALSGRIYDKLASHYGKDNVFIDIDNIPFGVDFREHVEKEIARSDILLAVIGPAWQGDRKKKTGVWAPNDWVRIEIESAMRGGVLLVPVLSGGMKMFLPSDLPPSIADLSFRNALDVDPGRDFHAHVDRLIGSIDDRFPPRSLSDTIRAVDGQTSSRDIRAISKILSTALRPFVGIARGARRFLASLPVPSIALTASILAVSLAIVGFARYYISVEIHSTTGEMIEAFGQPATLERTVHTPPKR